MRRLRNDAYARRDVPERSHDAPRHSILLFVLMFISVAFLVMSKLNHGFVRDLRAEISEAVEPALSIAQKSLQPLRRASQQVSVYFQLYRQLQELELENEKLKGWQWKARELERRLAALRRVARVVDNPDIKFVTGRVIAEAGGPFLRIALINAGEKHGVRRGYPVITGDGLIGRVIDTGTSASRVLLLTDLNSRVPVMVGASGTRALLLGDNSRVPRLGYLPQGAKVAAGEHVYTSGIGGKFPRGLRIGTLQSDEAEGRVRLQARLERLEYVSILFYEVPKVDAVPVAALEARGRSLRLSSSRARLAVEPPQKNTSQNQ